MAKKYLQLNVLSAGDIEAAKGLVAADPADEKGDWDAAIDGLSTKVETFIEDPKKLGTFIPHREEPDTPRPGTVIDGVSVPVAADMALLIATAVLGTNVCRLESMSLLKYTSAIQRSTPTQSLRVAAVRAMLFWRWAMARKGILHPSGNQFRYRSSSSMRRCIRVS